MGEERLIPVPPSARRKITNVINGRVVSWFCDMEIVEEAPPSIGLVLWLEIRHVRDWIESPLEKRAALFNPEPSPNAIAIRREARAAAPELAGALDVFVQMRSAPLNVDCSVLGAACEAIAEWALAHDYPQTAIEWAEIAALADPENPKYQNLAGRLTREANEYERAESWFKRGLGYAREQDAKIELIRAHLGYGRLCAEQRRLKCATKHLNSGSRLAWKDGPPALAAEAQHDLCLFLISLGRLADAEERARRALRWYPRDHPRLPLFAADVALLFVFERHYLTAARVLKPVVKLVEQPDARAAIFALFARALSGAGFDYEAEGMRRRAVRLLKKHHALESRTRWHLADAERLQLKWATAEEEAIRAVEVAVTQNDRETERHARRLLSEIQAREVVQARPPRPDAQFAEFIDTLKNRLAIWSPQRARRKRPPWGTDWAA